MSISWSNVYACLFVASCKHVQCPVGQHCLEDQNLMPHCVTCSITCPPYDPAVKSVISNPARLVCGVDGLTYRNLCEIKRTACMLGRSIPVAYRGACKGKIIFNQYYYHWRMLFLAFRCNIRMSQVEIWQW